MAIDWDQPRRPWKWALLAAIVLSAYFVVVYNITNALAQAHALHEPARIAPHFSWELHVPVIPWTIVPYWTVDAFFIVGPLLCATRRELAALCMRMVSAITIAGVCFVVWPLTLAWPRVRDAGVFQPMFDALYAFDKPHNLAPSLHIALLAMLWPVYVRHTRGIVRWAVSAWFALIFLSVFTTHQHHLLDVVTAIALAVWCWYVFPDHLQPLPRVAASWRFAARYLLGGVAMLALALVGGMWSRWAYVLIWPAFALGAVGIAYAGAGPWVYRKRAGRLPWSTRLVLAPVLSGAWLWNVVQRRRCAAWNEVAPNLWLGRRLSPAEARLALASGVVAVLDMTSEYSETTLLRGGGTAGVVYRNIPVLDLTVPSAEEFAEAVAFVAEHSRRGIVLIHCALGYSRSAAVVAAVLVEAAHAENAAAAVEMIRKVRPRIVVWEKLAGGIARHAEKERPVDSRPRVV